MFRAVPLAHHQEFSTVHSGTGICHASLMTALKQVQDGSSILDVLERCHDIYQCPNVQWRTPDDGQRNCPKYVEFPDKNRFGKISASVGFNRKINRFVHLGLLQLIICA